ncbi:MAG TPA: ATP-binding protein [Povalibacter sp.]|nr:ATP-binding protein [Povalibacter sp.]
MPELEATAARRRTEGNRLRDWVVWLGVLLIAAFVGADAYEAWQDYREAIVQNERAQLGLGRALAEQTTRMIQEIDVVLADSADWSNILRSVDAGQSSIQEILRADLRRLPFLHSVAVMDANGKLIATTQPQGTGERNVADRAFLRSLAQAPQSLHIGRPYLSPLDQYRTFAVSRPILGRDGKFAGAIVARISFEYLMSFYSSLNLPSEAAIQLVREDGTVLARYPRQTAVLTNGAHAREMLASGERERLRISNGTNGARQLVTSRQVPGYPVAVEVARSMSSVLAAWKQQELSSAARTLTLAAFAGVLLAMLRIELGRRDRLEQQQRRLERELREIQRAEALGLLAASMAHDFNNVLTAIVGYAEMARSQVNDPNAAQSMERLLMASERARQLVQRVLTFDPHRSVSRDALAVEPVVIEVLELIRASLPRTITTQLEDCRPVERRQEKIRGNATEVHQVLMNLCTNAVRAMPQGGRLAVRLEAFDAQRSASLTLGKLEPGRWLRLSVIDTGIGLTTQQVASMFEPFYTTRPAGQGTGIGLTVVCNIVKSMDGAIEVDSRPGEGTRMSVYWPLLAADAASAQLPRQTQQSGRGQAILIADDEPELVAVAEEMVASLGYEAIGFSDSTAALEAFRRIPSRFDAVLTDERMPVLHGTALASAIHDIRPDVPIVLVTGCREADLDSRAQQANVISILEKPLRTKDLRVVLSRIFSPTS